MDIDVLTKRPFYLGAGGYCFTSPPGEPATQADERAFTPIRMSDAVVHNPEVAPPELIEYTPCGDLAQDVKRLPDAIFAVLYRRLLAQDGAPLYGSSLGVATASCEPVLAFLATHGQHPFYYARALSEAWQKLRELYPVPSSE